MSQPIQWKRFALISGILWFFQATYTTLSTGLLQQYSGNPVRWMAISIYNYSTAVAWLMLTPLIFYLVIRITRLSLSRWIQGVIHIVLGLLIASVQRLITILFSYNLIKWTEAVDLSLLKISNFFGFSFIQNAGNGVLVYFVIVALLYGYLYYRWNQLSQLQKVKLESQLSKANLENLKYQLQPHFLFNSLQSVSTLMHRDLSAADRALGDIGELLRYSLRNIDHDKVSLGEELLFLQKYIDLQKTRFNDKLEATINYDPDLLSAKVPTFYLQPLVENSIKHVLEYTVSTTRIQIDISKEDTNLKTICKDNGRQSKKNELHAAGIGLKNLRERLSVIYNDNFQFNYGPIEDIGFCTTIILPLEVED